MDLLFQFGACAVQGELHVVLGLVPDDPQVHQLAVCAAARVFAVADRSLGHGVSRGLGRGRLQAAGCRLPRAVPESSATVSAPAPAVASASKQLRGRASASVATVLASVSMPGSSMPSGAPAAAMMIVYQIFSHYVFFPMVTMFSLAQEFKTLKFCFCFF